MEKIWKNLEPRVIRQRLIIEGITKKVISPEKIKDYLLKISDISNMKVILEPQGYYKHQGGGAGVWIHWDSSGAHFYTYAAVPGKYNESKLEFPLFTLDKYTCKPFSVQRVVNFTKEFLKPEEIVWKEIKV